MLRMLKATRKELGKDVNKNITGLNFNEVKEIAETQAGNFRPYRMTRGNSKLDQRVLSFSLPAVKSCLNCSMCEDTCYARKSQQRYPAVKHQREVNHQLATYHKELLIRLLDYQLKDERKRSERKGQELYVRIHVSGDFISQDYVDMWNELALTNPDITFFGYSKVFEMLDLSGLNSLPNVNIVNSLPEGQLNYGPVDEVKELQAELQEENNEPAPICPATRHNSKTEDFSCIKDCDLCTRYENVLFVEH